MEERKADEFCLLKLGFGVNDLVGATQLFGR
jgi:hypothetical protein